MFRFLWKSRVLCFTFPLFHGYDFSRKQRYLTSAQKSHPSPDEFGEIFAFDNKTKCNTFFFDLLNTKLFGVVNFDIKYNRKKNHNLLYLGTKRRERETC